MQCSAARRPEALRNSSLKTLETSAPPEPRASVLECGRPLPLFLSRHGGVGPHISLGHIRKTHIRGHSRAQFSFAVVQPHFDAKDLFDPLPDGLHIARRKLGFARNLLDHSGKIFSRVRVDPYLYRLSKLDTP